jgi:hypothetical protein
VVEAVRPPLPSSGSSLPHLTPANFFHLGDEMGEAGEVGMGCHRRDVIRLGG